MRVLLLALGGWEIRAAAAGGDGGKGVAAVRPSAVTEADLRAAATDRRTGPILRGARLAAGLERGGVGKAGRRDRGAAQHALDPDAFLAEARRAEAPAAREAALSLAALSYADATGEGTGRSEAVARRL
jgi:hypothetical protein